ncbi:MAG: hypothetical protein QXD84_08450, partial [Thermoplasmata archaeon]
TFGFGLTGMPYNYSNNIREGYECNYYASPDYKFEVRWDNTQSPPQSAWIRVGTTENLCFAVKGTNIIFNVTVIRAQSELSDRVNELAERVDEMNRTMISIFENLTSSIDSLNTSLSGSLIQVSENLTLEIRALDERISKMENLSADNSLNQSIGYLQENITSLADLYSQLENAVGELQGGSSRISMLQDKLNVTIADISDLQARMSTQENRTYNQTAPYNDTQIRNELEILKTQLGSINNNQTVRIFQNRTVENPLGIYLGVAGILIGSGGLAVAVVIWRRLNLVARMAEVHEQTKGTSSTGMVAPQPYPVIPGTRIEAPPEKGVVIEDVFLLYSDGRLISHQTRRLKPDVDDAIIGGMLTAVQSFIQESFVTDEEGAIKTLEYGNMKILIEKFESIYLAAVISGEEPRGLRRDMRHLLMDIWDSHCHLLAHWDGDTGKLKKVNGIIKNFIREIQSPDSQNTV